MYKIFLDKTDIFKCNIELEGAKLSDASPRIILENNGKNLIFYGRVNSKGECEVPIANIKSLFKEQEEGKIKLEVIADDTYFSPWSDNFVIDIFKKIRVEVAQTEADILKNKDTKKTMVVEVEERSTPQSKKSPAKKRLTAEQKYKPLLKVLKGYSINKKRFYKNKEKFLPVIKEYFDKNKIKYNRENLKDFLQHL